MTDSRYVRQTLLGDVGPEGQEAFARAKILVVGCGGLGSPVLLYLAAAGIGTLGLVDGDRVELSNLQRQVLFTQASVGELKVTAAARRLGEQNPQIRCVSFGTDLNAANAREIISGFDLIIDGTDNFETKFLVNDVCAALKKPWIYGAVNRWEGQVAAFRPHGGPCYRCLYPAPPTHPVTDCAESGVMGATVGVIGSWQAVLAIRALLPRAVAPWGKLLALNTASGEQLSIQIQKNETCRTCGKIKPEVLSPGVTVPEAMRPQGLSTPPADVRLLSAQVVLESQSQFIAVDVRTQEEWLLGHLPGAVHWPLAEIEKGHLPAELISEARQSGQKLLLYCQGGKRSARARHLFQSGGHEDVFELKGGFLAWPSPQSACPRSH